ncbi:MAG TPA: hypothetical protein ENI79_03135 [Rhodospirillales bacterium]|nr:hypothetical protein [Rhodospirillales bacterium]
MNQRAAIERVTDELDANPRPDAGRNPRGHEQAIRVAWLELHCAIDRRETAGHIKDLATACAAESMRYLINVVDE